MTPRYSRRRAMQTALSAAAVAALPGARAAARQSAPIGADEAAITADQVGTALAQLDGLVEDAMARTGVPGAAVAVVYDDAVVYERAFGVREVGKPEAVTPETVFQL